MYKMKAWADWENILEDLGDQEAREEVALDYTLAMVYNKGVDQTRYGLIVSELKNDYTKGQDDYPMDLAAAFALVNLYETPKNDQPQQHNNHYHVNNQQHDLTSIIPHQTLDSICLLKMPPTSCLLLEGMGVFLTEYSAMIVKHMGTMLVTVMSQASGELL